MYFLGVFNQLLCPTVNFLVVVALVLSTSEVDYIVSEITCDTVRGILR